MIRIIETKQSFVEMAKLKVSEAPKAIRDRTARLVIDDWFYDRESEGKSNLEKVAFRYSLGVSLKTKPPLVIDFDYGFISRLATYSKSNARISGAPNNRRWEFRALHIISNIPKAEGMWGRNTFKDSDFEDIVTYENELAKQDVIDAKTVVDLIKKFNLTKRQGNILQLCNDLLK